MKCYTLKDGRIIVGISLDEEHRILVGEEGRNRKLVSIRVPPDGKIEAGKLLELPAKTIPVESLILYIQDQSGYRGTWTFTPDEKGVHIIAEGKCAQGAAGYMGGGPELLVALEPGHKVEVHRGGRLYGEPADLAIKNEGGSLVVEDVARKKEEHVAAETINAI